VKVLRPELAATLGSESLSPRDRDRRALVDPASADPSSRPTAEVLYYVMPFVAGESRRGHRTETLRRAASRVFLVALAGTWMSTLQDDTTPAPHLFAV
jgi:hypothetical protein